MKPRMLTPTTYDSGYYGDEVDVNPDWIEMLDDDMRELIE